MNADPGNQEETQADPTHTDAEDGPAAAANGTDTKTDQAESPKPQRSKSKSTARKTRAIELTLTVTGTADGEWQAELKHGSRWVARGLGVPASAVSRAAKELHDELAEPIDEVINAAHEQQQARVAQLEAELEQAKQTLAELEK